MTETTPRRNREYAARMAPEQRREQLLDGVLRVIVDQGVHKVSIDVVARQVGVTRPVVYSVFEDSNDLLRASLDREEHAALTQIDYVLNETHTAAPAQRIETLVRGFIAAVLEAPDRWRAILVLADSNTPTFRKRLERGRRALTDLLETLLRSTIHDPDVDICMAAHTLESYMYDSARLTLADPRNYSPDRIAAFGAMLFARLALTDALPGA